MIGVYGMGSFSVTQRDYDNEPTVVTVNTADRTAANWDAMAAKDLAFQVAVAAATLGNMTKTVTTGKVSPLGYGPSSDPKAEREEKAMVLFHDTVTFKTGQLEIGCIDIESHRLPSNPALIWKKDSAENDPLWDAVVTALEDTYLYVEGGANAVEVTKIVIVHKNI